MSMDGLALYATACELNAALIGGKIDKVQQPERDALLFTTRAEGRTHRLLLSSHAENGRVQLTGLPFPNPAEPPMFCMLLRRRLIGARIERIDQMGLDRVLCIAFAARSELDDPVALRLIVELMGKHSNMTLVQEDGTVIDCIRHVTPGMSSVRTLLPGCMYRNPPAQGKENPLRADAAAIEAVLAADAPAKALAARFEGLSRATAEALTVDTGARALHARLAAFAEGQFSPVLLTNAFSESVGVLPFVPAGAASCVPCASLAEAYDRYYQSRDAAVRIARRSVALRHTLETHLRRAENKLAAYEEALLGGEQFEQARIFGELITANLHRIQRGQSAVPLENYYADPPEPCLVSLDPLLSPVENAQRYYKQYKKGRAAQTYAETAAVAVREEIDYLEGQLDNIEKCDTLGELGEIREELVSLGYVRPERRGMKQQKQPPSEPMRFCSSDGIELLVGKNNRQNDLLTLRRADSDNLWLHTKNIPGSHVIVAYAGMPPP